MSTGYYRAKKLWRRGHRDASFGVLRDAVAHSIGAMPFELPDYWMTGEPSAFEAVVVDLLTGTFTNSARPLLLAPFGRVWAALWTLDRYDYWLHVLLEYDFFKKETAIGFDDEAYGPPVNTEDDFALIARVVQDSVVRGRLSFDERDHPNAGRPVLSMAMIDGVDELRWGALKSRIKTIVADADVARSSDWSARVPHDAEAILIDFLHDLFCRHAATNAAVQSRWEAIVRVHPSYRDAVRASLAKLLVTASPEHANDIVAYDAGRDALDGLGWLKALSLALDTGDFGTLGS